jgi:hypothetical protein
LRTEKEGGGEEKKRKGRKRQKRRRKRFFIKVQLPERDVPRYEEVEMVDSHAGAACGWIWMNKTFMDGG